MDISSVCTIFGTVFAVVAAFIALRQYLHDKNADEQARSVAVYFIKLFDKKDNEWKLLETTPIHTKIAIDGSSNSESMAFGLVIENNSLQPIYNFSATINAAAKVFTVKDHHYTILSDFGDDAPLTTLPPGKWFINMDITSREGEGIMINSLKDVLAFEEAEVAFNPIIRDANDPILSYTFQDATRKWWRYLRNDKRGLHRCNPPKESDK